MPKRLKGKFKFFSAAILFIGLLVFSLLPVQASNYSCNKNRCDNYDGSKYEECLKDMENDCQKLRDLAAKKETTLQNTINLINAEQNRNQNEMKKSQQTVQDLSQQIADLEKNIIQNEERMTYDKKMLAGLMQSYYEDYQQGMLKFMLADQTFSDIMNQPAYLEQSSLKVGELLNSIKALKEKLVAEKNDLESKKQENENAKEKLQDRNLDLQYSEDQKQVLLGQTQADKAKYEKLLQDVEDEINQLDSAKGEADLSKLPAAKKGYFLYPVNPVKITQGYGKTSYSNHYSSGKHNGIDFAANYQNVFASGGGRVLATGNNGRYAYGKWIVIDHGDGLVTLYGHFSKLKVSKGSKVDEGDVIGTSGNTGYSTGPHLHFSVFSKSSFEIVESTKVSGLMIPVGSSVNPNRYLE